jgi:hypothetical protein
MKGIAIIGNKKKTYTIVLVVIRPKKPRGQKLNTKTPFNRIKKKDFLANGTVRFQIDYSFSL